MNYHEFAEHAKRHVHNMRRGFTRPEDDWPHSFVVELPDGQCQSGPLPQEAFASDATKEVLATDVLPTLLRSTRARKFAFITSTWLVERKTLARGEYPDDGIRPSQHPNRKEAVHVAVYDGERIEMWTAYIIRHRKRPPTLSEWEGPVLTVRGRFVEAIQEALR